jgi:hypothetical protein
MMVNRRLISLFFGKLEFLQLPEVLSSIFYFTVTSLGYLFIHKPEVNIITNIVGLLYMAGIYPGSRKKKVLCVFLICFLNMSCDVMVVIFFLNYDIADSIGQIQGSITVLLIAVNSVFIRKLIQRKKKLIIYFPIGVVTFNPCVQYGNDLLCSK